MRPMMSIRMMRQIKGHKLASSGQTIMMKSLLIKGQSAISGQTIMMKSLLILAQIIWSQDKQDKKVKKKVMKKSSQQPIPFQMGVTPMAEEGETTDELRTWYEGKEEQQPQARGSTDPAPKSTPKPRPKPIMRERSPRNLRNRQVARSILSQPKAKVHWNLQAQGRTYRKGMSPEQMKMEWDLHEPEIIQVHLDRQQDLDGRIS